MMKLRHLFNNPALAEMLLKNWEYDETSLDLFQYFRISANAIYPFKKDGEVRFLRCCPISEKTKDNILAELAFINYLRSKQYNALEPVPSRDGDGLVQKSTPWGEYYASVFKRVTGTQISETDFKDEIMFAYGTALGQLHELSNSYTAPKTKRWTHVDVFKWLEDTFKSLAIEASPMDELNLLREYFSRLPINPKNYGLVHYDFELDNVFYDETTKSCSVIDFDDAMYHWYIMDIVQAMESIKGEIAENEFSRKQAVFLEGYRSRFDLDDDLFAMIPAFKRFANLYGYARVARAIQEQWDNEPDWMVELRTKLNKALERESEFFGKAINSKMKIGMKLTTKSNTPLTPH